MSARPFTQPFHVSRGAKNPSTSSPSKHSLLSPDRKKHSSPSLPTRQPPASLKAATHSSPSSHSSTSSPSPARLTNPTPTSTTKPPYQTTLTPSRDLPATSQRGPPCPSGSSSGNGAPGPSDDNEPYDEEIRDLLQKHPYPEGRDGYLNVLRCTIMNFAAMSYDPNTEIISGKSDKYIKQLVRVLDELKMVGECWIGGEIVRPG